MIAGAIGAQQHHCASNAWRALITFPEFFRHHGHLVEGWLVIEEAERVTLVEHVWCLLAHEHIVDPSILLLVPETTHVFYFSGVTRDYAETEALEGALFPHVRFDGLHGDDGLGHPGYREARTAARRKLYTLALAQRPPKAIQLFVGRDLDEESQPASAERATAPLIIEGMPLDVHLSLVTSQVIEAVSDHCWQNARQALLAMPDAFVCASYIEGWMVSEWAEEIHLTEHGWICTSRSSIVDPSLLLHPVPRRLAYFPGVQVSWLEIQAYATERLPLARSRGLSMLTYQEACQQALELAEALAWQTGLPLVIEPGRTSAIRVTGATMHLKEVIWPFPVPSTPLSFDLFEEEEHDAHS
jgi:hypothetical protein